MSMVISDDSKFIPLMSGSLAGLFVDTVMYPIDTVKTRLQSKKGFLRAGSSNNVYSGLSAALTGSMPSAALFFLTYDRVQRRLIERDLPKVPCHLIAASFGEVMACLIRVPTEIMKQRAQVSEITPVRAFGEAYGKEGLRGLYRGFTVTVSREIPFSAIQFPLWEYLKARWVEQKQLDHCPAGASGVFGFMAGGTAAALTTPLDVAKTWIMLARSTDPLAKGNLFLAMQSIFKEHGVRGLFRGVVPRTLQISIGGAVFLGSYDLIRNMLLSFGVY